ncbi:MAG: transposase [Muribaculaceae bacterium]|nr:transposase [Muribaculaceae bacterium]
MDAFAELEDGLVEKVRLRRGESPQPTIGAIDSESSRYALPRSQKGIDGNKKVKGMKRNIITDKDGDILEASATPANIHDSKSAYAPVAMLSVAFPWIRRIYADI